MENSISIYEDGTFSVDLIKAQVTVATKAKILQLFYHKIHSIDATNANLTEKKKIALPPFVLRAPEEVPLAISLIKEKSEEFRHRYKLSNIIPNQYSDARVAMSILDPEVIKHIMSCFTKSKLKEMETMMKPLTNRHKKRNEAIDRYIAKLDNPSRVPLDRTKIVKTFKVHNTPVDKKPDLLEEVKIFNKTALVNSGHSTAFRLDNAAALRLTGNMDQDLERYKGSRKLRLRAGIRVKKICVDDVNNFYFNTNYSNTDESVTEEEPPYRLVPETPKNYLKRKRPSDEPVSCKEGVQVGRSLSIKDKQVKCHAGTRRDRKRSEEHETVEDIMAQFVPCSQFIVETERTVDRYDCRLCEEKTLPKVNQTSKNALTAHYRQAHNMERHYQCEKCDMILPSIDVWFLERHKTSTGCKPVSSNGTLKPDLITCEKCGQKFDKNSSYRDHYKKTHTTIFKDKYKKKVECGGCGLKFTNPSMLSLHEVYEQKLCRAPCSVCKEVFEVKLNCKLEKIFKESGLVDSIKCKSCS